MRFSFRNDCSGCCEDAVEVAGKNGKRWTVWRLLWWSRQEKGGPSRAMVGGVLLWLWAEF